MSESVGFRFPDFRAFLRRRIAAILPTIPSYTEPECLNLTTAAKLEAYLYKETYTLGEYLNQRTLRSRVETLLARQGIKEEQNEIKTVVKSTTEQYSGQFKAARPQKGRRPRPEELLPCPKRRRMSATSNGSLTAGQMREHLCSLRGGKAEEAEGDESMCSLCGSSNLILEPMPLFCSCCSKLIKFGSKYYLTEATDQDSTQHNFCSSCFKRSRVEIDTFGGQRIPKRRLCAKMNDEELEEPWVQCDECHKWNHQICGLYSDSEAKYKCPNCMLKAMETKDQTLASCNSHVTAKDLPQTHLGNYIQRRLLQCLRRDRLERAKAAGKSVDEVLGADDLCVRVVLSTKQTLAVNKNLLNVLQNDKYPTEFPYTTKMILLFQKMEGIDVCLFAMYVQEYGSNCKGPNHRYAYISYIDSVKYFKPDIEASTGEALRTLAYHEVLISYLDYVKKRGFASCYLWSCPPMEGDCYILNCHPETQKTPNPDRLRQWYKKMLSKAENEGIVVNQTTLYDRLFDQNRGPERKATAARLPYMDGDYWPGDVDNLLRDIDKELQEHAKKGAKKMATKTSLKVLGLSNPSDASNKDILLMKKLGEIISHYKEDFIVIDLQHTCAYCHEPILSGERWLCTEAKSSYLCKSCHNLCDEDEDSVSLFDIVNDVPADTKDRDGQLDNDICKNKHMFLQFCQNNQYRFDTLRRAKYSSMMILRHIRPTARSNFTLSVKKRSDLVDTLNHASQCQSKKPSCDYPGCRAARGAFLHASKCSILADGGCIACQKVWYALRLHSEHCTKSNCPMPYCNELKKQAV